MPILSERPYEISSKDTLTSFLRELSYKKGIYEDLRIKAKVDAEWIKELINNPDTASSFTALMNIQSYHQNWQEFDYIPSNLGKGFIFYFICNRCDGRVKYLYRLQSSEIYWCRHCNRIPYTKNQRSKIFK